MRRVHPKSTAARLKKGGEPVQKTLFEVVSAIGTAAVATLFWWLFTAKRNDHDEQDRDR